MKTLFNQSPLSKTHDPDTSFKAAQKMIDSGELSRQEEFVLNLIKQVHDYNPHYHPDITARELSITTGEDYHLIQRRLSGLNNKCKIERTGETRNGGKVWMLKK